MCVCIRKGGKGGRRTLFFTSVTREGNCRAVDFSLPSRNREGGGSVRYGV